MAAGFESKTVVSFVPGDQSVALKLLSPLQRLTFSGLAIGALFATLSGEPYCAHASKNRSSKSTGSATAARHSYLMKALNNVQVLKWTRTVQLTTI